MPISSYKWVASRCVAILLAFTVLAGTANLATQAIFTQGAIQARVDDIMRRSTTLSGSDEIDWTSSDAASSSGR